MLHTPLSDIGRSDSHASDQVVAHHFAVCIFIDERVVVELLDLRGEPTGPWSLHCSLTRRYRRLAQGGYGHSFVEKALHLNPLPVGRIMLPECPHECRACRPPRVARSG